MQHTCGYKFASSLSSMSVSISLSLSLLLLRVLQDMVIVEGGEKEEIDPSEFGRQGERLACTASSESRSCPANAQINFNACPRQYCQDPSLSLIFCRETRRILDMSFARLS